MKDYLKIISLMLVLLLMSAAPSFAGKIMQGELQVVDKQGKIKSQCPLKHTDVKANISGFITRVNVEQEFQNPFDETIEAVYVFPLPQNAAIDRMVMKIGKRTIKAVIKKKEEARKIYDAAKKAGKTTALLDQERPNIFTQSVANIPPGETVKVQISYVETLSYDDGVYEFVFPMVVGPRFMPGTPKGKKGTGWAKDTRQVPDASKISPPVAPKGTRAGHDINVTVSLDAGVPVRNIRSVLHKVDVDYSRDKRKAKIKLSGQDRIPNKDFILQYETAGKKIEDAILTHASKGSGFFTFILQPPKRPKQSIITPKEMFFVIDSSGSQSGWPIEKAKETMKYCIENMNPNDTFQLLSFANNVNPCFKDPVPNTKENREHAQQWLAKCLGRGGTQMMKAIDHSLGRKRDPQRMRIVVFMTDGYVGNDMTILDAIKKKLGNARIFPFGTGNSVNRYLLEGMAKMGKGEVEWVTLNRHGDEVAEKFQQKIGNPLLLDIEIDWKNAPVKDVYPAQIPDLFGGKPIIIKGRYTAPYRGEIVLKGKRANKPFSRKIKLDLPANNPKNDVLGVLWARTKIRNLMNKDLKGIQRGKPNKEIKQMITNLGLQFNLMTQFTSFVAVEEKVVNEGGKLKTITVPVEMPDGVSHEGVFGEDKEESFGSNNAPSGGRSSLYRKRVSRKPAMTYKPGEKTKPLHRHGIKSDDGIGRETKDADTRISKMAKSLIGLAEKVKKEGKNGFLRLDEFEVKAGKVELILKVTHVSDKVLANLKKIGLHVKSYSKANRVIRGVLSVDKLEELAKKDFVIRIDPTPFTVGMTGTKEVSTDNNAKLISYIETAFIEPAREMLKADMFHILEI
ncbi:MAG: VWA domain-containing protein [Candidatus Eremiobacteraeota bacterium]|nr:VWA domain-containing protein [Candidatus Eremiobacteraeota bacterium]